MNKKKHAKLLFTKNGEIEYEKEVEDFDGTTDAKFNAELDDSNMNKGTYKVYLRLYGDYLTEYDLAIYCLRFANNNIYDTSLKANLIGELVVA